jgi:hypothetical protein
MSLIPSLVYIRDNIQSIFYTDETDHILDSEIQRVAYSNDIYSIRALKAIIHEAVEIYALSYWRSKVKHSEKEKDFVMDEFIKKVKQDKFQKFEGLV